MYEHKNLDHIFPADKNLLASYFISILSLPEHAERWVASSVTDAPDPLHPSKQNLTLSLSDCSGCGGRNLVSSPGARGALWLPPPSAGSSATIRPSTPSPLTCLKSFQAGTGWSAAPESHALTCQPGGRRAAQVGHLAAHKVQNESFMFCVADSLCVCITGVICSRIQVSNIAAEFSLTGCQRPEGGLALTLCLLFFFF